MNALEGQIALVTGATRATGRATAIELGAAGATVYVTGRSAEGQRSPMNRPETLEQTAQLVERAGGRAVAVRADHTHSDEVAALIARIARENDGRLDVLVNDIWGGDPLTRWVPFWEHSLEDGLRMQELGLHTHLITSWHAAPLMAARGRGLIVEVTDGLDDDYRGALFYDLVKSSVLRIARGQAADLRPRGVACIAVSPGFLRSEAMLDHFGVTEGTWREGIAKDRHFAASETPRFVGRGIAALAADPDVLELSGQAFGSWHLARRYELQDVDGSRPDWGEWYETEVAGAPG